MLEEYWQRQAVDKPLFPDLLWSRPETKATAGKLAIIGGGVQGFASVAQVFSQAGQAGIGVTRVLLPDSLQKTVSKLFPEAEFAPSTPSGSFAQQSLANWLDISLWANGLVIAGDLGRNSETAILLEHFIEKYDGQLTLTGDSLDYFTNDSARLLDRPNTLIVPTFSQLQKLIMGSRLPYSLSTSQQFLQQVQTLHQLTSDKPVYVLATLGNSIVVAVKGQISTTPKPGNEPLSTAAYAGVWWLQNPSKPFEALSTSLF